MKYDWIHREIVENPDKFAGCEECELSAKYNELYAEYSELQEFIEELQNEI